MAQLSKELLYLEVDHYFALSSDRDLDVALHVSVAFDKHLWLCGGNSDL